MIKGNKGEWSEVYVFLKLLSEGKLYAADSSLNKIPDLVFPIIKIIRSEASKEREYLTNGDIIIVDSNSQMVLLKISKVEFIKKAKELFENLKNSKGSSFGIPTIESFLKSIDINKIKNPRSKKTDIKIVIHDSRTGAKPTLGFSIKSMLGKEATLFNSGKGTNFIYKFSNVNISKREINQINSFTPLNGISKITYRILAMLNMGATISFVEVQSSNLKRNLEMIDSRLPEMLSDILLYRYVYGAKPYFTELLKVLLEKNPLKYDLSNSHPFYEYKLKNFLTDIALGMTSESTWKGVYDATGGIIIVKQNGDVVCYHIYNRNEFQDYLLNNTKLNQTSTSRYDWGYLFLEKSNVSAKLNLCVRFND